MSTRSTIAVMGHNKYNNPEVYTLYKPSDGYPSHTLEMLAEALKAASDCVLKVGNEDMEHHKKPPFKSLKALMSYQPGKYESISKLNPGLVTGKIVGAGADEYGMGVVFDQTFKTGDGSELPALSIPGDVEWVYVINTEELTCDVFNGAGEMKDPMEYLNCIRPECKESERKWIQAGIDAIQALGFSINVKQYNVRRLPESRRQLTRR